MSKNRNCLQGWKCPYDNTLLVEKNLCPQRLKKGTCVIKKKWMKLNSKWTIRVKGNMYTDVNIQWYSELMKTKKNNACPLIKEIEEHDDVSSEKKIRYMESMQMLTYIQQDTNEKE